ncbi:glycosyltransferase family 2 protein [Christiangramia crocea]|uniref:Glycosyltransferase family 2 protein n=1 Tax=Christiangramia crocea TaxID=2904124 RepID=A0A9X1UZ95_9FLAO|nr:glycosyltransferase family 2 protein [Gramella crocea]MCG9973025.1 glycosyltransferase family 2 protein [Gramella crocea]
MMYKPLISIIIPTYNRANYIRKTLESIKEQTYTNWECIIVDDGSEDNTLEILQEYLKHDSRFKLFARPKEKRKGANSCRNYGFTKCKGKLIKWFDSDDIMLSRHLEIASKTLTSKKLDFVITNSLNFDSDTKEILGEHFDFDREEFGITAENLALNRIGWITDDFLGTREIVKDIEFNERIFYGDEYNFFIKLLQQPLNGCFINEFLTHRRIHKDSITKESTKNELEFEKIITTLKYQTAQDLIIYNDKKLIRWFLAGYMRHSFNLGIKKANVPFFLPAFKLICKYYSFIKGSAFLIALISAKFLNRGYKIMHYART